MSFSSSVFFYSFQKYSCSFQFCLTPWSLCFKKHNKWCQHNTTPRLFPENNLKKTTTIFSSRVCVNSKWNIVSIICTREHSYISYSFWQNVHHFNCFAFVNVIPETDWYLNCRNLWFCLGIFIYLLRSWNYFDIARSNVGLRSLWIVNIREINHNVSGEK